MYAIPFRRQTTPDQGVITSFTTVSPKRKTPSIILSSVESIVPCSAPSSITSRIPSSEPKRISWRASGKYPAPKRRPPSRSRSLAGRAAHRRAWRPPFPPHRRIRRGRGIAPRVGRVSRQKRRKRERKGQPWGGWDPPRPPPQRVGGPAAGVTAGCEQQAGDLVSPGRVLRQSLFAHDEEGRAKRGHRGSPRGKQNRPPPPTPRGPP